MFVLRNGYEAAQNGGESIAFTAFLAIMTAFLLAFAIYAAIQCKKESDEIDKEYGLNKHKKRGKRK